MSPAVQIRLETPSCWNVLARLSTGRRGEERRKKSIGGSVCFSGGNPRSSAARDQGVTRGQLPMATAKGDPGTRGLPEPVHHLRAALRHLAQVLGRYRMLQIGSAHLRAQALESRRALLLRE